MRKQTVALLVVSLTAVFALGVLAGRATSYPGVRVYRNDINGMSLRTAYHSDWPTYGLPLAEMAALNNLMADGFDADELDRAQRLVNATLDAAIIDAHQRLQQLPDLPETEVESITKAMAAARRSRERHPPPDSYEPHEGGRARDILLRY